MFEGGIIMTLLEAFIALFIFLSMFNINYRHYKRNKFTGALNIEYLDLHFIFSVIAILLFFYYTHSF